MKRIHLGKIKYRNLDNDIPYKGLNGYKLPGKSLAVYSTKGFEYVDFEGTKQCIPKSDLADFIRTFRKTDKPWLQYDFSQLFFQQADPYSFQFKDSVMPGMAEFMNDLPFQAKLDYQLLILGARIAQLQLVYVGKQRNLDWCAQSTYLRQLYNSLTEMLEKFETSEFDTEDHAQSRKNQQAVLNKITELEQGWTAAIAHTRANFLKDWDTRNILLNLAFLATGVGALLLLVKNIELTYEGEELELFQFTHAYSKQREYLVNMQQDTSSILKNLSHFKAMQKNSETASHYFGQDLSNTNHSLSDFSILCDQIRTHIDLRIGSKVDLQALRPSQINYLNGLYADLNQAVQNAQNSIKKLMSEKSHKTDDEIFSEQTQIEQAFMQKWDKAIRTIPIDSKKAASFGVDLSNKLLRLYPIAEQFEKELAASSMRNTIHVRRR